MKKESSDWEWGKKPRRVEKGTDKASKHRKSIYNILSDADDESEFDSKNSDVRHRYDDSYNYTKRR